MPCCNDIEDPQTKDQSDPINCESKIMTVKALVMLKAVVHFDSLYINA